MSQAYRGDGGADLLPSLHRPSTPLLIDGKKEGIIHSERGLTLAILDHSGHMGPSPLDAPEATVAMMKFLLGQIEYDALTGGPKS